MSPVDHERPASAVEMSGVKVSISEGRTPTSSDWPAAASTSPPLVAVAVASTWLDQERAPSRRKNNCQNVLAVCPRLPIGTVAQVPPPPSTEVASGVGREGAAGPADAPPGALAPQEARQIAPRASPAVALAQGPVTPVLHGAYRAGPPLEVQAGSQSRPPPPGERRPGLDK